MTRAEILALPAGRELDALVAEKVMGYAGRVKWYGKGLPSACPVVDGAFPSAVPHYSTDPAADYAVFAHVREIWHANGLLYSFFCELASIFDRRCPHDELDDPPLLFGLVEYAPGDYARAALLTKASPA